MRTFINAALLGVAMAAVDYTQAGANWEGDCATGKEQSPIDLKSATATSDLGLKLDGYNNYPDLEGEPLDGKTFQVNDLNANDMAGTMTLTFDDASSMEFQPLQLHFHGPSEHYIDGAKLDLEMHIVHADANGSLAVLGIFFDRVKGGDANNAMIEDLKEKDGVPLKDVLDAMNTDSYWSYPGSLTTPPCTEGVKWTVLTEVQPISAAQLEWFKEFWTWGDDDQGNNRVPQPLNARTLYIAGDSGAAWLGAAGAAIVALAAVWA